ncbi:Double zinc ribbon [Clostridium amylolyticum]|uniref:Double zinc ribbon n=1 Tax=Clostridium amylolyticum TaxID=1121298 RepID=A0A1M6NCW8_9CLOT|nr:TM2 domain-containing protein [Clostridium amylolyticum]SHJ93446.1 Double zinc ribbon [Clostridium amylolyticum]
MYCRNCGEQVDPNAKVCVKCGSETLKGKYYCNNCGQATDENASICSKCGIALKNVGSRSKMVAGLLGLFLGSLGVHRFYLGYIGIGILQIVVTIVTCGIGSLWGFIEGILILVGNFDKDFDGNNLAD